jgi:hypothetical protein
VNGWFDPTIERVSQSFTNQSHYWTAGISLLLALLLQIDSFKIVNRLAIDDALRASLVQQAQGLSAPAAPSGTSGAPDDAAIREATKENVQHLRLLATQTLITWPTSPKNWWDAWNNSNVSVFGVLLSAVLLSFGAPFWFNVLGDLLKLRPALAAKDDQQRQDRESSQPQADGGGSTP